MLVGIVRLIFWTSKGGMGRWKLTEKEGWIRIEVRVVVCVNRFVKMKSTYHLVAQPTFQCQINVASTLWTNTEITLIRCWKWNKIRHQVFNVAQHWNNVAQYWNNIEHWNNVAQRWYNVVSILFKGSLNIVETTFKPLRLLNMDL